MIWGEKRDSRPGRTPAAPAHSASLVNRASSLNTFAGHSSLAHTVFWRSGPGLRVVSGASSPNTFAGQTPPLVTKLRRPFSSESLFSPHTKRLAFRMKLGGSDNLFSIWLKADLESFGYSSQRQLTEEYAPRQSLVGSSSCVAALLNLPMLPHTFAVNCG